ncbi:HET-domain-containing protein [Hypoxylon crocopeplum]|nr:HET-domain-containing protein [Hypoxylon crocopeplum]
MAEYQYKPLPGKNYIRVVSIHPGKSEDDIVISFRTSPFPQHRLCYDALSYVWGSETDPLPVYVGRSDSNIIRAIGKFHHAEHAKTLVTQNLAVALKHLRYVDKPRAMWIDALCINQADEAEKGPQVAMMGEIYRLAYRVVAWLGPEENDSNHAMDLINNLGSKIKYDPDTKIISVVDGGTDPSLGDRTVHLPFNNRDLHSIYHLISRKWFERLWIRQEILLANSEAIITCGSQQVGWTNFRPSLACIFLKPKPHFRLSKQLDERIGFLGGFIIETSETSLVTSRYKYGNSHCADPRDRLYAILALLSDAEKALIPSPDYSKSCAEIYTHTALQWFDYFGILDLITQCELQDDASCPSWVPDWSRRFDLASTFAYQFASSQLQTCFELPQPDVLRITGIRKTTVKRCHLIPDLKIRPYSRIAEVLRTLMLSVGRDEYTADTYAKTLGLNMMADYWAPPRAWNHDLDEAKRVMELILSDCQFKDDDFIRGSDGTKFLTVVSQLRGKRLIQGTGGFLGLGPESAQEGDEACVILGCSAPLLLRPLGNDTFKLVGPCFMAGLSDGEAFLGPLPEDVRIVEAYVEAFGRSCPSFKNTVSGEVFHEDPRLKLLPLDLDDFRECLRKYPWDRIYVDPEMLRGRGVDLRWFDLV